MKGQPSCQFKAALPAISFSSSLGAPSAPLALQCEDQLLPSTCFAETSCSTELSRASVAARPQHVIGGRWWLCARTTVQPHESQRALSCPSSSPSNARIPSASDCRSSCPTQFVHTASLVAHTSYPVWHRKQSPCCTCMLSFSPASKVASSSASATCEHRQEVIVHDSEVSRLEFWVLNQKTLWMAEGPHVRGGVHSPKRMVHTNGKTIHTHNMYMHIYINNTCTHICACLYIHIYIYIYVYKYTCI